MTSPLEILSRSFHPIALPDHVLVGCAMCGTAICGVYLLVGVADVVYVGSSTDIIRRLYDHDRNSRMPFERAMALRLPRVVMRHYEGALIRELRPVFNGSTPKNRGYDAEILYGLGLRAELAAEDIAA